MKALKIIGIVVVVVLLGGFILRMALDKEFNVTSQVSVDAPKEVVWEHVASLEKQNEWSPWADKDPNMTSYYEGKSGAIGSLYHWSGNDEVGEGEQEITALTPMERVEQDLRFIAPWESTAEVFFNVGDGENGSVTVEWGFVSEHTKMSAIMDFFMDMAGSIEADYKLGLDNLKAMCEAVEYEEVPEPVADVFTIDGYDINNTEIKNATYIGVRQVIAQDKIQEFMSSSYQTIMEGLENAGYEPAGAPSALYFEWNMEEETADMAAVFPLGDAEADVVGLESFNVPQGRAFQVDYYGDYDNMVAVHGALEKGMHEKGMQLSNAVVEEYLTDPGTEEDPSKWLTRITYPVIEAEQIEAEQPES